MKTRLKLFRVSQDKSTGWDYFDSAIVVAKNRREAARIFPTGKPTDWDSKLWGGSWAIRPEAVTVEYVGVAKRGLAAGTVVCASFNAA